MSLGEPAGDVTARETAALYRIARLLAGRQRLADVFEEVAEQIGEHVRLDFASLMVLDAEPDMERVVGWYPPEAIDGSDNQQYRRSRGRQLLADQYRRGVEWDPAEFRGRAERRMTAFGIKLAWSMPLLDGDDYYGTVTVARIEAESFAERELEFLRRAGDLLAAAAREEHAIWRADREGVRSRLLNELTILLNQGRSVEELFSAMVAVLSRAVTFDAAGLMRTNESNQLGLVAADPPELGMVLNDVEVDVEGAAIRNADRWLQFAPTEVGGDIGERLAAAGIRMACAVFLTHLGKTVGALILSRGTMREFSEDDLSFLALAATLMAQAIVNRDVVERELEESRAETAEQRALAAIAAISADERTPSRLLEGFAATLGRFVPAVRSAFAVLEGDGLTVYRSHSTPLLGDASMLGKMANLPGQVTLSSGYEDLLGDWDWFGGGTIRAVSIAPDRSAGSLRGVLIVAAGEPGWDFGEREERVVRTAAQFVGSALHTAHNLKRLERSRALLELVVGSLSAGIVLFDRQGQAAFVNGHGQRVLDSLRPQSMSGGIPVSDEEPGTGVDKLLQALAGSWFATGEAALEFAGESRLHRYEILPMDHDSYSRLVVFEDIEEERRRAAENERHQQQMSQAARLSALGEMIGGVAHELNNPLTAILGFAELLTAADGVEPIQEDLTLIHKEALRARNIVRDLLFLVRPGEVEREELRLGDVVGHIERLRHAAWLKQGIAATIEVSAEDTTLTANEHQLTQVLLNLTTNAEQALAGKPGACLSLRARFDEDLVVLEVEDNGPGMTPEVRERLWEPFYTTKPGIGTGLGLSLSRSIVQSHGGTLTVESSPGCGACFRVTIPRDWTSAEHFEADRPEGDGGRWVLVVDDEPSLRTVAKRLIESLGHHCDVAAGVDEATALAAECAYDLVLCDYRLASDVADDVVTALQTVAPQLVQRVVIATGATTDAGIARLVERYGLAVLAKPYGIDEITNLLRNIEEAA